MDTVTVACAHVPWDSLFHVVVYRTCHFGSRTYAGSSSVLYVQQGQGSTREASHEEPLLGALAANLLITEESKPSDSTKDNEGAAEVENEAEVEVVESRDRKQGSADTENAVGTAQVSKASDSAVASATEKDTIEAGELHRLLNN